MCLQGAYFEVDRVGASLVKTAEAQSRTAAVFTSEAPTHE